MTDIFPVGVMQNTQMFSPAVVAPTYDNARTLAAIVTRITQLGLHVFVVNDGSTDDTAAVLTQFSENPAVTVITHEMNRGKAAALMTGFAAAQSAGCTHVVTIDTDGQLDPDQIPTLLEIARREPAAFVIGTRDATAADYPARSRLGRRASNLLVRMESGLQVTDSQCGFRIYPLRMIDAIECRAGRYGFETEVLTRAAWAGFEVRETPVACSYLPHGQRVSHFRPWIDSFRAVAMHARLASRALVDWISPIRAWQQLRREETAAHEMATGFAVGVFIANLPLYGVQTLLSLYAARRLRLHPLSVVAGSHISTPPIGAVLIALAIGVGHWLLHGKWLEMPQWEATWSGWAQLAGTLMLEWTIGGLLIGTVMASVAFFLSHALLRYLAAPAPTTSATPAAVTPID
ncbi:MAG: hypothetical protein QOF78_1674 [Phycisphaerales bacterium]|jgi:uncharacterized protein (DUF2062 family)|nr:hypothetical protein [Phycisphaerales bacterium]